MLRIRLSRVGRKHDPSYRLVVTEKGRAPQTGAYVEQLGTYDARSDEYELKSERISYWISEGAQPTDTVHNLLVQAGIIDGETVNPLPQKSPVTNKDESEESSEEKDEEADEKSDSASADEEDDAENDSASENSDEDTNEEEDDAEEEADSEEDSDNE